MTPEKEKNRWKGTRSSVVLPWSVNIPLVSRSFFSFVYFQYAKNTLAWVWVVIVDLQNETIWAFWSLKCDTYDFPHC